MKANLTALMGVLLLDNIVSEDKRGTFVKTFHAGAFQELELAVDFRESYYSVSHRNVIGECIFNCPRTSTTSWYTSHREKLSM